MAFYGPMSLALVSNQCWNQPEHVQVRFGFSMFAGFDVWFLEKCLNEPYEHVLYRFGFFMFVESVRFGFWEGTQNSGCLKFGYAEIWLVFKICSRFYRMFAKFEVRFWMANSSSEISNFEVRCLELFNVRRSEFLGSFQHYFKLVNYKAFFSI